MRRYVTSYESRQSAARLRFFFPSKLDRAEKISIWPLLSPALWFDVFSRESSFSVSAAWQGVHKVRRLSRPVPPPPSATATS